MATPPRGWLNPAEPQGIGMTQVQFWAPKKKFRARDGLSLFLAVPLTVVIMPRPFRSSAAVVFRREENVFRRAGSAGFSPSL